MLIHANFLNHFKYTFLIIISVIICSQDIYAADSSQVAHSKLLHFITPSNQFNKKRTWLVNSNCAFIFTSAFVGLNAAWYKNYPRSGFHFFNDNAEWQQMDKAGHFYTAYSEAMWSYYMYRWAGNTPKRAAMYGVAVGFTLQMTIEILDGFSTKWGFSPTDVLCNTLGGGLVLAQGALWNEQKIVIKYSAMKQHYPHGILKSRADDLYGASIPERILKDYNGQTYWLSANIASILNLKNNFPKWLNVAVGYGAQSMYGGERNPDYLTKDGKVSEQVATNYFYLDPNIYKPYRQFYLSPDIDFTRIKTKNHFVKTLLLVLNVVKLPAPALELSKGKLSGHLLYF